MKILGIDSSGMVAGVAVVDDDILLAEYTVNYKKTHSETLLPMIDEIVRMTELDMETIDAIAVAAGPGSFTGLRIGSATVKGLGLALNKDIIEIPTCMGLAYNVWGTDALVCPIMDARRKQVYTAVYRYEKDELVTVSEQRAVDICRLMEELNTMDTKVIFVGDGVPVYRDVIGENAKFPYTFAPAHCNRQRAAAVAALGVIFASKGLTVSAEQHKPIYLRKSQAEREREEKMANEQK
ncbi:MAG: tRNA (adenosine(37)-N6)-threonylcarbamoyltransferase complex dimerization subunit type 1 TsaB [Clostridium sp.]|nr:tRNA (adenosine(37)-N6)-threonylcarbamoyltransferase complex dimerization subunit type 1 TsaB [Clostridium sp.]MCM1399151.1 tRNA (adenosine(37)-N6)-threonylcarbamoyltransferase complex dimerization subunit type 1 TsaB [Clostridium sp.]MCM1459543.1 tRNA (adenosine(37)-N6)-threonylcarbamoyltransferase complex dimerization subunit type 1 TsaB [Bacteroides sp.]